MLNLKKKHKVVAHRKLISIRDGDFPAMTVEAQEMTGEHTQKGWG